MIWSARLRTALGTRTPPEPRTLLHGQGSGRRPLQDAIDVDCGAPEPEEDVRLVRDECAGRSLGLWA
jgi:hypothetical protein